MSLLDALLLDPSPFECFVAYRTDSLAGSGTLNDPWNSATKYAAPSYSITALTNTGSDQREATVTAAGHNFANNDVVTIAGVTGLGAIQWNATFTIYGVSGSQFKYYMIAVPGGTATVAASTAAKVSAFRFDDVMAAIPAGSRVNLGPTPAGQPFLTRGYAEGIGGLVFQPKAGMRISGSGVDITTIQLVPGNSAAHFFAFGHALTTGSPAVANPLDFLTISDLTIDCQMTVPSGTAGACGAVRIMGNHVRVSRVKAINWGSRLASPSPGFVFATLMGDPATSISLTDTGFEDCTALAPATSTTGEVLIFIDRRRWWGGGGKWN